MFHTGRPERKANAAIVMEICFYLHEGTVTQSVNITCGLFVAAEEIWPHGVFLGERRPPQTPRRFPVALAQQLFTFVFQIICKHKEIVGMEMSPFNTPLQRFCVTAQLFLSSRDIFNDFLHPFWP